MVNTNTKNILLIGRTGGGKSTLGNVLINKNDNFDEVFEESAGTASKTRSVEESTFEVNVSKDGNEKIKYRIIDTIGLGDTKLTPQGVLTRLAEIADRVKSEGLNQILFVNKGRFTKEEIEAYDLLSSIIFDEEVINYTTVVRTAFPNFEDKEKCADDRASLRMENADLAHILDSVNIIYLDNPPLEGRPRMVEMNKEVREESRKRLLTYLGKCRKTYQPSNIDELDKRVHDYKTNEQLLKDKMKELEADRKRQEEEFRKKLANLKEEQAKELRENRKQFEEKLHKTKVESEEKLRTTVNDLEDKQKKKLNELEEKNKAQLRQSEERGKQEIKNLKDEQERQNKAHQEDLRKQREESDRLREDLNKKNDNSELITMFQQQRLDDQAREERRDKERLTFEWQQAQERREFENKRLESEESRRREESTREERHRQEEARKEERHRAEMREIAKDNRELEAKIQVEKSKTWIDKLLFN